MKKIAALTFITLLIFALNGCQKDKILDESTTNTGTSENTDSTDGSHNNDDNEIIENTENTENPENTEVTETPGSTESTELPETTEQESIDATISSSLEDIFTSIYAGIKADEKPMTMTTPLTADNEAYFIGATGLPYTEALASEAMISAIAHSIILLRFEEGADLDAAKEQIRNTIDPRKWVCVGVEDELVVIESFENIIIVIVDNNSQTYYDNFTQLMN
jgi:hypothetical protein